VRTSLRDKRIPYGAVSSKDGSSKSFCATPSDLQAAMDALKAPDGSLVLTSGEEA
jgi:hypothetical protein